MTMTGTDKRKISRTETEMFTDLIRDVSVGVDVRIYKNYIFETGQAVFNFFCINIRLMLRFI